ncbi:hypothetical protein LJC40_05745, partial [Synergistaceae bacterium OttesenSCG-928-D05]|nr:hypothetical protein [Synergistaceae bacterium OttesenSCG-928-D05]
EVAAPAELMQMLAAHGLLVADAPIAEQQPVEAAVLPREKQILPKEILPQTLFETAAASVQDLPSGFSVEVDEEGFLRLSFKSEGPLTDEQVEIVNQKMGELSARMEELAGQTSFLAKEQKAKNRAAAPQTPKLSRAERRQLEREERKKQKQEEKRHPAA